MIWDSYAKILENSNISGLFGMVGDGIGLLESASVHTNIKVHTAYDQRIAISMAAGYAKAVNQVVCYAASPGPALANLSMGLLEAYSQCIPIIIVSNGVARYKKGSYAFQEFSSIDFMKTLTKWTYRVEAKDKLAWALHYGIHQAKNGKPGPVYIEIPDDLINEKCDVSVAVLHHRLRFHPPETELVSLAKKIKTFKKPVIISGAGCIASEAHDEVLALVNQMNAAIFCTASGRGIISEDHQNFLGLLGLYLTPPADEIFREADVLFFIGSQCEETALMGLNDILKDKTIIQLNVAPEDIGRGLPCHMGIIGDAKVTIKALLPLLDNSLKNDLKWKTKIADVKSKQHQLLNNKHLTFSDSPIRKLFNSINAAFGKSLHLVLENGLHDMWGYFYPVYESLGGKHYSPGEHTGLGLALGNAIGVKLAHVNDAVVAVIGDGAFNFGKDALFLVKQFNIGITFIVINNRGFSWPRLMQKEKNIAIGCEFHIHNLEILADEYDMYYATIDKEESILKILNEAAKLNKQKKSALIQIHVDSAQDIPIGVINHFGVSQQS